MITEHDFAKDFYGFWGELLPLLTPNFVRIFNESYRENLIDEKGLSRAAIPIDEEIYRNDIVAELAFNMSRIASEQGSDLRSFIDNDKLREDAETATLLMFRSYVSIEEENEIEAPEWEEALRLCENYKAFLAVRRNEGVVEFAPKIPGAGFIASCRGDLSIGKTLYEIKTVNRNLASKDIRQLLIYLALQSSTGKKRWNKAGFFNPRRALCFEFMVDQLLYRISGGRSSGEVFQEIIDRSMVRDIHIDTKF